jgi:hypothetical protein
MELFLVISQGIGLALACGVSPFLPPLLAGAFARADLGVDFEGSGYGFLESSPFLLGMLVLTALWIALSRSSKEEREPLLSGRQALLVLGGVSVVLGALEFAGSLGDEGYEPAAGLPAGAAAAAVGLVTARAVVTGARSRLAERGEGSTASYLEAFVDGTALAIAILAIAIPPFSYVALALCGWLLLQRRRRAAQKYEGLRVLR